MSEERHSVTSIDEIPDIYKRPYLLGRKSATGKVCLDTGCGTGYLTSYMAQEATSMTGIDYHKESIQEASGRYPKIKFLVMDCRTLDFPDATFDVVLSFEFIEHLKEEDQHKYLREVVRVLKPKGKFVVSTPNKKCHEELDKRANTNTPNEWHLREMYENQLVDLLDKYFDDITMMYDDPSFVIEAIV